MKLTGFKVITGTLKCESGLHIGGSAEQIEIGGVDLPIIKHPVNGEPFVPGSSLKGKMRCQLEKRYGKVSLNKNGEPTDPCKCGLEDCLVCKVFGSHQNPNPKFGPTRILVRDAFFNDKTRKEYEALIKEKGTSYIEKKTVLSTEKLEQQSTLDHKSVFHLVQSLTSRLFCRYMIPMETARVLLILSKKDWDKFKAHILVALVAVVQEKSVLKTLNLMVRILHYRGYYENLSFKDQAP